ncbi:MAG: hypothetical protein M3R38_25765, partial [Actinomycetota bacterium]|nr:hypothetical protein [Actinomycetota bacterium]
MAISFRSSSTANTGNTTASSITINKPTGVAAGDLLLAFLTVAAGSNAVIAPPSGWTLVLRTNDGTATAGASYYKVAGASEPTSYQWGFSGTGSPYGAAGGISAYTGVANATPLDASVGQAFSTASTSLTSPAVLTSVADTLVIRVYGTRIISDTPTAITPPSGTAERYEVDNSVPGGATRTAETADAAQAAAGDTGTATAASSLSVTYVSQTIVLRPADVTPPGAPTGLGATPGFSEIS